MKYPQRAVTVGTVLAVGLAAVGLGTGVAYQRSLSISGVIAPPPSLAVARAEPVTGGQPSDLSTPAIPSEPEIVTLGDTHAAGFAGRAPVSDLSAALASIAETASYTPFGLDGAPSATAEPDGAGNVRLSLQAPMEAGQVVQLHHAGLRFSETIDAEGRLVLTLPALAETASFEIRFEDGTVLSARADVPEATQYERTAVRWQAPAAVQLHAFAAGVGYGEPGHLHAGVATDPSGAAGQVLRLGRDTIPGGWMSEIYSRPVPAEATSDMPRLSIEAVVTPASCGRSVLAETVQVQAGQATVTRALRLAMPGCSAIGDILVVEGAVPALELAAK